MTQTKTRALTEGALMVAAATAQDAYRVRGKGKRV